MNTETKYTTVIKGVKKPLLSFAALFLTSIFIAKFLGVEGLLLETFFSADSYRVHTIFTHYSLTALIVAIGFLGIATVKNINTFFEAINSPQLQYDIIAPKYDDMPIIPNSRNMYKFMRAADKIRNKGSVHLSDEVLRHWKIDQNGNKR